MTVGREVSYTLRHRNSLVRLLEQVCGVQVAANVNVQTECAELYRIAKSK